MKQFLLGTFLATLAMYGFGAAYWMSPIPTAFLSEPTSERTAVRALLDQFPESGTYFIPSSNLSSEDRAAAFESGPIATLHLQREGRAMMSARYLGLGFLQELVCVGLVAMILKGVIGGARTYVRRVLVVMGIGLVVACFGSLGNPIWFHHPWPFHILSAVYDALAWLIAGIILAAFIRPGRFSGTE